MAVPLPQLVEGQVARLDVGASLPCRVIGFSGRDVVLALDARLPEELDDPVGGYLLLESGGHLRAVRGQLASPAGEEIVWRLTDDIRLGQRRQFSRAPLALPARLTNADGKEWTTVTRDVSAGGVGVARRGADPGTGPLELRLVLVEGQHEIVAEVSVARETAADLGLRFERIEREDRLQLAALAFAYHRRR
jgi:PilZ domain-containing protein